MRTRRITLLLRNRTHLVNILRLTWIILVLWFELGLFRWSLRSCNWPDAPWKQPRALSSTTMASSASPAHLLVLADTQILDAHSLTSVNPLWRRWARLIVDSNLRKSWTAVRRLKPDAVLFLGDMINGGRYAVSDAEYETFAAKFRRIFTLPPGVPVYYVVGNHDVGLGHSTQFSNRARRRFEASFQARANRVVQFGNHSLVLVDAPGLVEEDYRRVGEGKIYPLRATPTVTKKGGRVKGVWTPSRGGTVEFISGVGKERQNEDNPLPAILFSHIPFARPERSSCGSQRERKGVKSYIQKGAGPGYQNLLGKGTSTWVLETLEPLAVFSADDHDYCEVTHSYTSSDSEEARAVKETTVKAFSISAGIRRPGVQLLSFWNPLPVSGEVSALPPDVEPASTAFVKKVPTFADRACLLPDQSAICTHGYLPLILLTTALLIWMNLKTSHAKQQLVQHHRDKSLPLFDSISRYHEAPLTMAEDGMTHRLRAPNSRGSSSFPSSPLGIPVLLQPDGDEDGGSHSTRTRTPTPTTPASPWTPLSAWVDPTPGAGSTNWEVGGWKRTGSRSSLAHARSAGSIGSEREKERGDGWRRPSSGAGAAPLASLWAWARGLVGSCAAVVVDVLLGRTRGGSADSLWKRCAWDGLCVALPGWIVFGLVDWWLV